MTDSDLNISEKVLKDLARLAKVKNQSVQELAEQLKMKKIWQ